MTQNGTHQEAQKHTETRLVAKPGCWEIGQTNYISAGAVGLGDLSIDIFLEDDIVKYCI